MNYFKKANILQILVLSLVFNACGKDQEESDVKDSELPENVLPKMKPLVNEAPLDEAYIKTTRQKIAHFYNKNWPGKSANGAFLVAKNGQIIFEKYDGLANFSKKDSITPNTPLHIASVSKVLTATAILKLVNANRLKLDQKVNTILKEFPFPDVTVRMLLNHRSGLRNYAYFTDRNDGVWDRHNRLSNQDILTLLATKNIGLESRTNTRFAYCNTNYAMLALIIEKITKKRYKEVMTEMIFKPLGMTNTFVFDYEKDKDRIVPSYKANRVEIGKDYLDEVYGDKNIYSTVRDLLKFDRARNRKDFLEPELAKQVYVGYSNEKEGEKNYGLGIRMINWKTGQNFYFHNGWWHGNTSAYITLPKEQVTIIALSNKMNKSTYNVKKVAPLFGDYPFETDTEE
ncbi:MULTISPECIES: serine hydrolase domain-containing protein [Flavobacterium]|uniref:Beta-lactamase family protein n=1 Tax=Flavobacterium keumense TaxID=1306518 RepID=A0ABY8N7X1_9FLAO|nr:MULTISPECIES: serine hydrolase domain-containing protein [Flavobacterium]WGK94377.1 beta-lactamase family protein [Flavobacterium keumense]